MSAEKSGCKSDLYKFFQGLSCNSLKIFKKSSLTKPQQHVGMFAGSLLSYDTWTPTKGPH